MNAVIFRNFTSKPFTGRWDGVEYNFAAGQEMYMEGWKANHFAKHLIDRELTRLGEMTNNQERRSELLAKAVIIPDGEVPEGEILDRNSRSQEAPPPDEEENVEEDAPASDDEENVDETDEEEEAPTPLSDQQEGEFEELND